MNDIQQTSTIESKRKLLLTRKDTKIYLFNFDKICDECRTQKNI